MSDKHTLSGPIGGRNGGETGSADLTGVPAATGHPALGQLARDLEAGLFLVEADGTVSFATRCAQAFLGIQAPDGNGSRPGLESGNAIAREVASRIPAATGEQARTRRGFLQLGGEGDRFLSVTLSPLRSTPASGQWVGLLEDVTDIVGPGRQASQWARDLVHDLKSPLSTVAGAVDLIFSGRLGEVDPKLQNFLNLIQKGVDRLIEMLGAASKNRPTGAPEARTIEGVAPSIGQEGSHGEATPHRG